MLAVIIGQHAYNDTFWVNLRVSWLKLVQAKRNGRLELYDLAGDPSESTDLVKSQPEVVRALRKRLEAWIESVDSSVAGGDYPEDKVADGHPQPQFWMKVDAYRPYFEKWRERPEYQSRLQK